MTAVVEAATRLPGATRVGSVTLAVADRDALVRWYGTVLGLVEQARDGARSVLGPAGGEALLMLEARPGRPPHDPRKAGLFHVAFLLPSRAALARWVRHVAETGVPIGGASDHLVSEAFYLADPEGNGIEVYRDRAPEDWPRQGGRIAMATEPADVDSILALAATLPAWDGAPADTRIGHVHLKVADLEASRRFYIETLGLDLMATYPGALFVAAGGYHHHLGLNVWQSRDRPKPVGAELGLEAVTLVVPDAATRHAAAERAAAAGYAVERVGEGAEVTDPAGHRLRLAAAA